jgi:hypothetical protein
MTNTAEDVISLTDNSVAGDYVMKMRREEVLQNTVCLNRVLIFYAQLTLYCNTHTLQVYALTGRVKFYYADVYNFHKLDCPAVSDTS